MPGWPYMATSRRPGSTTWPPPGQLDAGGGGGDPGGQPAGRAELGAGGDHVLGLGLGQRGDRACGRPAGRCRRSATTWAPAARPVAVAAAAVAVHRRVDQHGGAVHRFGAADLGQPGGVGDHRRTGGAEPVGHAGAEREHGARLQPAHLGDAVRGRCRAVVRRAGARGAGARRRERPAVRGRSVVEEHRHAAPLGLGGAGARRRPGRWRARPPRPERRRTGCGSPRRRPRPASVRPPPWSAAAGGLTSAARRRGRLRRRAVGRPGRRLARRAAGRQQRPGHEDCGQRRPASTRHRRAVCPGRPFAPALSGIERSP